MKQGKANGNATSCWSPYADQLLIPQLRELAGDYGLDGACVDGKALPFEYPEWKRRTSDPISGDPRGYCHLSSVRGGW
jgi:hypothetical protein